MADPFIGEIIMFGGNFSPAGWAFCRGQLLPIAQNTALFSILGTTYGGDGETTFGLPDLRGRSPIGAGSGPGLAPVSLGARGGAENHVLSVNQIPSHNHQLQNNAVEDSPNQTDPDGHALAEDGPYHDGTPGARVGPANTVNTGGNQSFSIRDPYAAVNFIIAIVGIFPSPN